jgi:hypothetical protein
MNDSASAATPTDETDFLKSLETSLGRVDQGITAHSYLREKFARRGAIISAGIIIASALVTFLAVASVSIRTYLQLSNDHADHIIGLLGFIVLICAILELQIGWREKSSRHAEAAGALSRLKLIITRELASDLTLTKARFNELQQAYESVNDLVAKIPENRFLELKALHKRKVEISKFLDKQPGSSVRLLKVKIWLRDNVFSWPRRQ